MAEYICFINKDDVLVLKPPKKSPTFLRMVVLLFAMACGVYICTLCLKQLTNVTNFRIDDIQLIARRNYNVKRFEAPRLHYPEPTTFSRAECQHNPVRFFAIISMQRSGSGWFETLLNSHMNVSSNGEIFSPIERRRNISTIIQNLDKVYNLDWFTSASKNECSAAVGYKWMLNQGIVKHHREIVDYFNRRDVSVIFLFRKNLLRRIISLLANSYDRYAKLLNGIHKSHVHSVEEANTLSSYKPVVNSTSLIKDMKEMEMTIANTLKNFDTTRHMILYYEDLVVNQTKLQDVQEFLNIPIMKLTSRQVKIHKGQLSDQVKNWDDIDRTLKGTEYAKFLLSDY